VVERRVTCPLSGGTSTPTHSGWLAFWSRCVAM